MTWPATRLTTYTDASPPKPGDLNSIQDAIIAGKHGDKVLQISGSMGVANSNVTREFGGYSASITSTGATDITFPVPLRVGDRIKSVTAMVLGNGAADIGAIDVLYVLGAAGAGDYTSHSLFTVAPAANTPAVLTQFVCDVTDHTLAAGEVIFVGFASINAAGIKILRIEVTYDHP